MSRQSATRGRNGFNSRLPEAHAKAIDAEEQKLKAKMEKYKKFVEDAPKIAAERQREQREELHRRAAMTHKGAGSAALIDRRATLEANIAAIGRMDATSIAWLQDLLSREFRMKFH